MNPADAYGDLTDRELLGEVRRLASLRDPATMGRYLDPDGFKVRAHTRFIAKELTGLGTEYDRLLLATPPQVGKSTLASELLPFWWLSRNPTHRNVIASYAGSLAIKKSRAVRRYVIEQGPQYGMHLMRGETSAYDWSLTTGGGLRATGVGGSLTGFPITGIGIVDDPHKDRREADSLRMRNRVWEWWSSVFLSRLRPGVPVVIIMTRWHEDDLGGRVVQHEGVWGKGGRWRVVNLPAISVGLDDPLGRSPGMPLTHPAITDEDAAALLAHWNDKKATSTPRDWGALYQGDPQPVEGALITLEELAARRDFETQVEPERIAVAVDPSGGGRDTAGIIAGYRGTDGKLYITHDRTRAMSSAEWARKVCLLAYEIKASVIFIERYGGDLATLAIRTAWDALTREGAIEKGTIPPYCDAKNSRTGKLLRAEPIAQQWREDRIRTARYLPELEGEWASWQPDHTDSPGRIDASVYLAYGLLQVPGVGRHIGNPAQVSLTQAASRAPGGGLGSVPLGRGRSI